MEFSVVFPIVLLFVLFFLKVPIAYSMLIATVTYFLTNATSMPTDIVVQRMVSSCESFTYLAIPFFTCAGVVFNYAGITKRLLGLADLIVGHMRGGLGQVNVVLSALMGGLSGSANADAAMQAKILVPEMTRLGYDKAFSTVVTATSSCITPIIPPGIILILYATASNVSIQKMFFAGYLPGLLIMAGLMVLVGVIARKRNYKPSRTAKPTAGEVLHSLKDSIWALFLPFGLLMGLRFGIFTPTEAGAMCVVYSVIIGKFVYKELKLSQIPAILKESVTATAGIMFIIGAANAFGSFLTWERIPIIFSEFLINSVSEPWMLLLVVNILLLIVGFFFEGGAAMILLAPLLVPAASAMGIELIHFGIVMAINLTIAGVTPPFGAMMFTTLAITEVPMIDYIKEVIPFLILLIGLLLLFTFVPQIILCVPNLLA